MNTKKKSSWLSLILALAMMITTSLTGLMPVSGAADTVQAAGETRTIYYSTFNDDEVHTAGVSWNTILNASDQLYIYSNGIWTAMEYVKGDELNQNNGADGAYDGVIWKGTIDASTGSTFRFGYVTNGNSLPTSDLDSADYVSAEIKVTDNGYDVLNPNNKSQAWLTINRESDYKDVFYHYARFSNHNHGVDAFASNNKDGVQNYTESYVTTTVTGNIYSITDLTGALGDVTITYKTENASVTKDVQASETASKYSFKVPANDTDSTAGEYVLASAKDSSGKEIFSDVNLKNVSNGQTYYYGEKVDTTSGTEDVTSEWKTPFTGNESIAGKKLYIGDSNITKIYIGGSEQKVEKSEEDNIFYVTIPEGTTQQSVISAKTNDQLTTFYFYWEDTLKDELVSNGTLMGVTEKFVASEHSDNVSLKQINGKKYVLDRDLTYNEGTITITQDTELDLAGHRITTKSQLFNVTSGKLTIIDSGDPVVQSKTEKGCTTGIEDAVNNNDGVFDYNSTISNYKTWVDTSGGVNAGSNSFTINYFVTESDPDVVKTDVYKGTKDTRYEYSDTLTGGIYVSESTDNKINQVINVGSGGSFELKGGVITADVYVQHLVLNAGEFTMNGGYLVGAKGNDGTGGAAVYNSKTMTMNGGVIAQNHAWDGDGGGIYTSNDSTLTINDGVISGNIAGKDETNKSGGGIFSQYAIVTINGGYLTNNYAPGNSTDVKGYGVTKSGGGAVATRGGKFYMNGGYVTGNLAGNSGGGLYIGFYNEGTEYKIAGGYISSNLNYSGEGGGIRIAGGSSGKMEGTIYVTNNYNLTGKFDTSDNSSGSWGGGGIFVQTNGKLEISKALVTGNDAEGYGGGVGSCPTGNSATTSNEGAAIYDNQANKWHMSGADDKFTDSSLYNGNSSEVAKAGDAKWYFNPNNRDSSGTKNLVNADKDYANDYFFGGNHEGSATMNGSMLGDTDAKWSGVADSGEKIEINQYGTKTAYKFMGLTANPSNEDKIESTKISTIVISGNYSYTHGGGIMTNGTLIMGTSNSDQESYPNIYLNGVKAVEFNESKLNDVSEYAGQFEFEVVTAEVVTDQSSGKLSLTNVSSLKTAKMNADGSFNLYWLVTKQQVSNGKAVFYLVEKGTDTDTLAYDHHIYKVEVGIETVTGLNNKTNYTFYKANSVTISKLNDAGTAFDNYSTYAFTANDDYSGSISLGSTNAKAALADKKATFTNKINTPKTNIQITKNWKGSDDAVISSGVVTSYYIYRKATVNGSQKSQVYTGETNGFVDVDLDTDLDTTVGGDGKVTTTNNVAKLTDVDVYYDYTDPTTIWTYGFYEVGQEGSVWQSNSDIKLSDGHTYKVIYDDANREKVAEKDKTLEFTVTNKVIAYTLPLTGSSGWNKGSLYLLMLLIAVSAVGIYTVNKLKRETQVYAKKQEEN